MSSVVNINRWDQSRFEKFAEESSYAFEEFMIKGHAYTPVKAYIFAHKQIKTGVMGKYTDSLNVINYYNPSFRSVLPNMDGAMHSHSQTYGLFFMSFITGFYNVEIYKCFAECSKIWIEVDHMLGGGANGNLLTTQSVSEFDESYIIGFSKDVNIVNLAVRYSGHRFSYYRLSDDKLIKGRRSTETSYKEITSNKVNLIENE